MNIYGSYFWQNLNHNRLPFSNSSDVSATIRENIISFFNVDISDYNKNCTLEWAKSERYMSNNTAEQQWHVFKRKKFFFLKSILRKFGLFANDWRFLLYKYIVLFLVCLFCFYFPLYELNSIYYYYLLLYMT